MARLKRKAAESTFSIYSKVLKAFNRNVDVKSMKEQADDDDSDFDGK